VNELLPLKVRTKFNIFNYSLRYRESLAGLFEVGGI
jgi:hypothetical protein